MAMAGGQILLTLTSCNQRPQTNFKNQHILFVYLYIIDPGASIKRRAHAEDKFYVFYLRHNLLDSLFRMAIELDFLASVNQKYLFNIIAENLSDQRQTAQIILKPNSEIQKQYYFTKLAVQKQIQASQIFYFKAKFSQNLNYNTFQYKHSYKQIDEFKKQAKIKSGNKLRKFLILGKIKSNKSFKSMQPCLIQNFQQNFDQIENFVQGHEFNFLKQIFLRILTSKFAQKLNYHNSTILLSALQYIQGFLYQQITVGLFIFRMQQTPRKVTLHFFLIVTIIIITSVQVWHINVVRLQHGRNFYRALNYHILEHQVGGVYWFGQKMINYPINQYYQLGDIQTFMKRMWYQMGNLEFLAYGPIDQTSFNQTKHRLDIYRRNGKTEGYQWTLKEGLPSNQPFSMDNLTQIKAVLTQSEGMFFVFEKVDLGSGYLWDITFQIQPFSDTSIFVRVVSHQIISLASQHVLTFISGLILGILMLWQYYFIPKRRVENLIYCFLSVFLVGTSVLAFSEEIPFQIVFIFDGITCCAAWLCSIKFYLKQDDYNMTFLLGKSYAMIGWIFASFGPLLIAFSLFGYVVFSRYSGQFSSFWRTFLSLFYICYYNMTYESAMVTSRANPISLIFFVVFVLLFTMCVYSGMLVSVFCSYVWKKRQLQIRKDIENNLRIQCSNCDHKYRYLDTLKVKPKASFNLSEFLEIDFKDRDGRDKYKIMMKARIQRLRRTAENVIEQGGLICNKEQLPLEFCQVWRQQLWKSNRFVSNLLGE